MQIIVYGNLQTCGKCKFIHQKLEDKNIKFSFIDNEDTVMNVANQHNMRGIPFANIDNEWFNSVELMKKVMAM